MVKLGYAAVEENKNVLPLITLLIPLISFKISLSFGG